MISIELYKWRNYNMSKTSVLALIIALGALGIGIYQIGFILFVPEENHGITNVWSDFYLNYEYTDPASSYINVDDLLINFTVDSGESVLFLLDTRVTVLDLSYVTIYFSLDGVTLTSPDYPFKRITANGCVLEISVSFHLVSDIFSPGAHNVSIIIYGTHNSNSISISTLIVQTYV
jgi:hypothetical protein